MCLSEQIEIYEKEIESLQFDSFTNLDALEIGKIMVEIILRENLPLAVDINVKGQTFFRYAHTGSTIKLETWLERKLRTALFCGESTILFAAKLKRDEKNLEDVVAPDSADRYVKCGGAFPIIVKGEGVIGAFSSSGLVDTEDHRVLVESIRKHLESKG